MSKRAVNLLRKMALPYKFDKTNPLTGIHKKWLTKTADYTCVAADSGATILVNPAATTLIQLPAVSDVGAGWHVTIVIDEQDGGTMDQIVNIGTASGEFFQGWIIGTDGGGSVAADPSQNDFINCSTNSTSGEKFEIVSDGTYMHCSGGAVDVTDTKFANTAAS